jgi:hypothetical protein
MKFLIKKPNARGNRIYGTNGRPELLLDYNWVINGEWEVGWDDPEETTGYCASYPGRRFKYIFHVIYEKGDSKDYNNVLYLAKEEVNNSNKGK